MREKAPPLVQAVADELYKCNRCGFCQSRCPVYRATGLESLVARGHFARLQSVLEGELPLQEGTMREGLFACLMCRACTAECPPGIETDRVVAAARASYLARRQSCLQRLIFRRLLASPREMQLAARALGWLKRTRLTALARLLLLLPWCDRGLAEAPEMMPAPGSFLRERLARRRPGQTGTRQVTYFCGCAIDYALPDAGEATLDVLTAADSSVAVAANVCCGLPPYSYGDREAACRLARRNLDVLEDLGGEAIVTDCASCASFLKDYPRLFEEGDPDRARAEAVAARVREASEFLAQLELPANLRPIGAVVTYHDPCHLSRYQKVTAPPRDLLRRLPGVEYRELPEADWCCGGAGSYALTHHDLSLRILERKMENIRTTGADVVVTPCPACLMQLRYGARRFGVGVEVVHLTELVRRALPQWPETVRPLL